jgi:biotin carboxyl carrier protein
MPGAIVRLLVSAGDRVSSGDTLLVLEAMKMETEVKAPQGGKVQSVAVSQGEQVTAGQALVYIG